MGGFPGRRTAGALSSAPHGHRIDSIQAAARRKRNSGPGRHQFEDFSGLRVAKMLRPSRSSQANFKADKLGELALQFANITANDNLTPGQRVL
jgi:hypothetical protein